MANLSMIEEHNELFTKISRAKTVEDIRPLVPLVKKFYSMYEGVDNTAANRIYELCKKKLHELVEENETIFSRMTARAESVSNRMYDFAGEQDDRQAVNNMVLQLISQLPKVKTTANASGITKIIEQSMKSVIGCKAVLELMKYPAYIDMIDERQRQRAFDGSKSESQKTFEKLKEKELAEVNKALSDVYLQGFHLRTLEKQIIDFKKPTVWSK